MNDIILDVRISKYEEPVRMIAIFDRQNGRLTIERALPYALPKDPYKNKTAEQVKQLKANERYTLRVVDDPNIYKWDLRFQEQENLTQAIASYYELQRSGCLILGSEIASRYLVDSVLQTTKVDANRGNAYEIDHEQTSCGHIAVLAACWAALRSGRTAALVDDQDEATPEQEDDFLVPFTI
ncbi:hypothetical protein DJ533_00160 (plasmid) [Acinetobacter defluvii]|uniref:Uncharacterized protein n=1 Tax=Acinetobacter defluvii TaxID=1871111 RepID=A0A2S2F9X4_9GAMM|nr:hypothetical protein [Acinetobacter defluvii]AWL27132.1 hypothetical protein DJ533_00160 [Acinetobacter defluvii]